MASDKVVAKAHRLLVTGKVTAVEQTSTTAYFQVQGSDTEPYDVKFQQGVWICDCPARVDCAHLLAVRLVSPGAAVTAAPFAPEPEAVSTDELNKLLGLG